MEQPAICVIKGNSYQNSKLCNAIKELAPLVTAENGDGGMLQLKERPIGCIIIPVSNSYTAELDLIKSLKNCNPHIPLLCY